MQADGLQPLIFVLDGDKNKDSDLSWDNSKVIEVSKSNIAQWEWPMPSCHTAMMAIFEVVLFYTHVIIQR